MKKKNAKRRQILVTTALPYANGPLHLGHLVEAIQADIWCRWQKLQGHDCLFISGDDVHGTPIMLTAQQRGITPEDLVAQVYQEHQQGYQDFLIDYDNFYHTHSIENQALVNEIFQKISDNGDIEIKTISQPYDPVKKMFLADRFIKGTCPKCKTPDQYGDSCEQCGATYNPMEMIDPISSLSGVRPIEKETEHYFFQLQHHVELLKNWIETNPKLQSQVAHKLKEWFRVGLKPWDISRDEPYFGFLIPNTENKYFYVWLDAPIGYMATLQNLINNKHPELKFSDYWNRASDIELYHFIGKDIVNFHGLFWPALLHSADYRLPTSIFVHGYITINGQKMSKSRGTFITAREYLNVLNPEYLRYYFAAKLNGQIEDIDLDWDDFKTRVNADLVGKYVNLASRCARFILSQFDGMLSSQLHDEKLYQEFIYNKKTIGEYFEKREFNHAIRLIMTLTDRANQYIDHHKPWSLAKETGKEQEVQQICTQGLNLFRILTIYLKPILPILAKNVEKFLNIPSLSWNELENPLLAHHIQPFQPLMQRITDDSLHQLKISQTLH